MPCFCFLRSLILNRCTPSFMVVFLFGAAISLMNRPQHDLKTCSKHLCVASFITFIPPSDKCLISHICTLYWCDHSDVTIQSSRVNTEIAQSRTCVFFRLFVFVCLFCFFVVFCFLFFCFVLFCFVFFFVVVLFCFVFCHTGYGIFHCNSMKYIII